MIFLDQGLYQYQQLLKERSTGEAVSSNLAPGVVSTSYMTTPSLAFLLVKQPWKDTFIVRKNNRGEKNLVMSFFFFFFFLNAKLMYASQLQDSILSACLSSPHPNCSMDKKRLISIQNKERTALCIRSQSSELWLSLPHSCGSQFSLISYRDKERN